MSKLKYNSLPLQTICYNILIILIRAGFYIIDNVPQQLGRIVKDIIHHRRKLLKKKRHRRAVIRLRNRYRRLEQHRQRRVRYIYTRENDIDFL
jgi:hypothetical protein